MWPLAFDAIDLRFDGERVTADSEAATPETFELIDLDETACPPCAG